MKLSEIANEVGVEVCMLTAEVVKSAGTKGLITEKRAEELVAELEKTDGILPSGQE